MISLHLPIAKTFLLCKRHSIGKFVKSYPSQCGTKSLAADKGQSHLHSTEIKS